MSVRFSNPDGVFVPLSFSQLVSLSDETLLVLSGQVAFNATGDLVGEGDLRAQTVQVFENIKTILVSAKATFADVLKLTIYVVGYQAEDRFVIADVQKNYVDSNCLPTSTLLGVQSLARPGLLIEIDVLAIRPSL